MNEPRPLSQLSPGFISSKRAREENYDVVLTSYLARQRSNKKVMDMDVKYWPTTPGNYDNNVFRVIFTVKISHKTGYDCSIEFCFFFSAKILAEAMQFSLFKAQLMSMMER